MDNPWLEDNLEPFHDPEAPFSRIEGLVQEVEVTSDAQYIAGVGELPAAQDHVRQVGHAARLQRQFKRKQILRITRHLDNVERLHIVVEEMVLCPFDAVQLP